MPLVLGVDSSTSACKVEVRDADTGTVVASGRAPHPRTTPPRSEQDPSAWLAAFEDACAQAGVPHRRRPAAVAIAAQQHGLVVSGPAGEVLRPAKLWNDTESAPDADELVASLPGGELRARSSNRAWSTPRRRATAPVPLVALSVQTRGR